MDLWLIVGTPDGIHCWPLGDRDPALHVLAAKALLGVPPGAGPMLDGSAWDVQVAPGRPHDTLLGRATLHDLADLAQVDVAEYRAAEDAEHKAERVRSAKRAVDALDPTAREQLLAEYTRSPDAVSPKGR